MVCCCCLPARSAGTYVLPPPVKTKNTVAKLPFDPHPLCKTSRRHARCDVNDQYLLQLKLIDGLSLADQPSCFGQLVDNPAINSAPSILSSGKTLHTHRKTLVAKHSKAIGMNRGTCLHTSNHVTRLISRLHAMS